VVAKNRILRTEPLETRLLLTNSPLTCLTQAPAVGAVASAVHPPMLTGFATSTLAVTASASPTTVTGTTTTLSASVTDSNTLSYAWSLTSAPWNAPFPTVNSPGAAKTKSPTVTFYQAGTYVFSVKVTDSVGNSGSGSVTVTVVPTLTSIDISPNKVTLTAGAKQNFLAVGVDQFGNAMAASTTAGYKWTATYGKITSSSATNSAVAPSGGSNFATAVYTAPVTPCNDTVTVSNGTVTASASVAVTLAVTATASPSTVTGTTTTLSASVSDGNSIASYAWSLTGASWGVQAPTFNSTAASPVVTFKQAGLYEFTVKVTDSAGLTGSASVLVSVVPTLTSIAVTPKSVTLLSGAKQTFSAVGVDQFGNPMANSTGRPTTSGYTWSATYGTIAPVGGSNSAVAVYTATTGGNDTVTVTYGTVTGSASVTVTTPLAVTASALPSTVTGTTTALSATVTDSHTLSYLWTLTSGSTAAAQAPTFNSTAASPTVTFHQAGTYVFAVKVTDSTGLSGSSSVTVTVVSTLTKIAISPSNATIAEGATQTFAAIGLDQFGNSMGSTALPTTGYTWTATLGSFPSGSTSVSAVYTASKTAGGDTVTVTNGNYRASTSVTVVAPSPLGLKDPLLAAEVQTELSGSGGQLTRSDMIAILEYVATENGGVLSSTDMADLKTLVNTDTSTLKTPSYVDVLAADVVDGNTANAHYQGKSLGNLAVGSSATVLTDLVNKWFLGLDLPTANAEGSYTYSSASTFASDPLFSSAGPSYTDLSQGDLGDCYLLSALGSIAKASPQDIENMFINNGDGTYTVRFFTSSGTADYVTVNTALPVSSSKGSSLIYSHLGAGSSLWLPLAEKAYAEWNETGNEARGGKNDYASVEGGWMGDVYGQVLGSTAQSVYSMTSSTQLINAVTNSADAVTIGTDDFDYSSSTGLYGDHAYVVLSYNANTQLFQLYNPWGTDQPSALTWSQLVANCDGYSYISTQPGTGPITSPSTASTGSHPHLIAGNSTALPATMDMAGTTAVDAGPSAARPADAIFSVARGISSDQPSMLLGGASVWGTYWQLADATKVQETGGTSAGLSADAVDSLLANGSVLRESEQI
jgi:D-serine deaminase-like pyridoxal phosphate-dependent protein